MKSDLIKRVTQLSFVLSLIVLFATPAAAENLPPPAIQEIGIDQRLGDRVPLDLEFRDEAGRVVRLGEYFGSRPVVLSLVYYECPMLCSMVLSGLVASLRVLNFDVGKEFDVVTVSFDPREAFKLAGEKKSNYLRRYGRPGAERGWHFLTGDSESIKQLTRAVGFRYQFDPETKQFAHASAIMVLTPTGQLSHYFYGIEYPARDLRLALVEASKNKIGSLVDQVLLYCYQYDPKLGKYSLTIMRALQLAGVTTVLVLTSFIYVMVRRERKKA